MEIHAASYIGSRRKEAIYKYLTVCFFQMCAMCVEQSLSVQPYRLSVCLYKQNIHQLGYLAVV